jgi:ribosomal protein L22
MSPSKPGDPQKGKPAEAEQAELEAQEAKEAAAVEAAQEKAATGSSPKASEAAAEDALEPTAEDEQAAYEAASEEEAEEPEEEPAAETEAEEEPAAEEKPRRRRTRRKAAEPAEEPAPKPARRTREPGELVVVRAQAKYVRTSARKARLVCDHIRGKSVQDARAILAHTPRAVARDWSKLLESAVANAEHNHELLGDDLRIAAVSADEGPTLKRFRPRAMGRATRIRKRTSHLTILLTPKES